MLAPVAHNASSMLCHLGVIVLLFCVLCCDRGGGRNVAIFVIFHVFSLETYLSFFQPNLWEPNPSCP